MTKIIWFTGLPSSGKSTIANVIVKELNKKNIKIALLDGEEARKYISPDLGFSLRDRNRQMRRLYDIGKLLLLSDITPLICTNTAPTWRDEELLTVYIDCGLEECMKRDVKRLYARAKKGEIRNLPGIDLKYIPPKQPQITIRTDIKSIDECAKELIEKIVEELDI